MNVFRCVFVLCLGALVFGTAYAAEVQPNEDEVCVYAIRKGDTLSQIAVKLTGTVKNYPDIKDFNQLDSERLYAGELLALPLNLLMESALSQCDIQKLSASTHNLTRIQAEIEVRVFEDVNGNGQRDDEEDGLPEISVMLIRGKVIQPTDTQGLALFNELEPGQHAVALDEGELPEEYRLTTPSEVLISLTEGDRGYVDFGVQHE